MFTKNGKLSDRQIRRMGILENIPAPLLVIPYISLRYGAGLITLFAGLILTFLYALLMRGFAEWAGSTNDNYLNVCPWYVSVVYVLRYGIKAGILLWYFSTAIKNYLMYDLNQSVILIVLAIVTLYGSGGNVETRGRTMEMIFMWTIVPLVLAGIIGVWNLKWSEIGITFRLNAFTGVASWIGVLAVLAVSTTFELFLYSDANRGKTKKPNFYYIIGWVFFAIICGYLMIVGTLGNRYPSQDILNGLSVMESIGTGIRGLRRIDYLVLTFLVVGIFAMISGYYFRGRQQFQQIFKKGKTGFLGAVTIGFVSILSALVCMKAEGSGELIGRYLLWVDLPVSILIPLLVIGVRKGIGKKGALTGLMGVICIFLCGCWYGEVSSIENQDYVSTVTIAGSEDGEIIYTFTTADLSEYGGKPGDSVNYADRILKAENLSAACRLYQEEYERMPDLGHLQEIVIQESGDMSPKADMPNGIRTDRFQDWLADFCNDPSISKSTLVQYPDGTTETLLQVIR